MVNVGLKRQVCGAALSFCLSHVRSEVQCDGAGMREECRHSGHPSMKEMRGDEREKQRGRKNSTTIKAF